MRRSHTNKHWHVRSRFAALTVAALILSLVRGPVALVPNAYAASSFRPTVLVSTEAFLAIDDDDTTADVVLRFGDTLSKTLTFNRTLDRFDFNDDVYVTGMLRASTTVSGAVIYGSQTVRSSGSLTWEGAASGATLYVGGSINGAGLGDCDDGTNSKLLWDATLGRFSCGTDQTGSISIINLGGASAQAYNFLSASATPTLGVIDTSNDLFIEGSLEVDDSIRFDSPNIQFSAFDNTMSGCTSLETDSSGNLVCGSDDGLTSISGLNISDLNNDSGYITGISGLNISQLTNDSGYITSESDPIYYSNPSGYLTSISGLSISQLTNDANYTSNTYANDMNQYTNTSSSVTFNSVAASAFQLSSGFASCTTLETDGSGNFVCGTDDGAAYTAGQGLSLSSNKFSLNTTITGSLVRFTTVSGSTVVGKNALKTTHAAVSTRFGLQFLSGALLNSMTGFGEFFNARNAGLGTKDVSRISRDGNIVNVGSIQAGQTHLSRGGTYLAKTDHTAGWAPEHVVMRDFNGDGVSDVIVANFYDSDAAVYINAGTGGVFTRTDYATGTRPQEIAVGDFNGDGKLDFVTINESTANMSVFINKGNGTFHTKVDYSVTGVSVAVGDVNGDGQDDIATLSYANPSLVSIFLNDGAGKFGTATTYATGGFAADVAIGDMNGDNRADIATTGYLNNKMSVLINSGTGAFTLNAEYSTTANASTVTIGDVNNDNKNDVVVGGNGVSVFLNTGTGGMTAKTDYSGAATDVAIGDLNGDGVADIATATSSVASVHINKGNGTFHTKVDYTAGTTAKSVAIGDLNRDGKQDLVVANNGSDTFSKFINDTKPILFAGTGTGGAVGIGTSTPGSALSVSGSALFGSNIANRAAKTQLEVVGTISGSALTVSNSIVVGKATGAGKFLAEPPAVQSIAAGNTISDDACGTVKRISATTNVTTNTTNTFTAPSAANAGCVMHVVNTGTTWIVTLDANTNFKTPSGVNVSLSPNYAVTVVSTGSTWYVMASPSSNF